MTVSVYLESRYRKLERGLPQTVLFCPVCKGNRRRARSCSRCEGFGKLSKDSVQELIARCVLPRLGARQGKFHGAGREDVDVLMLGRGRPFVFEVVGAHREFDLAELDRQLAERLAGRVELAPLRVVGRDRVVFWKESHFEKIYRLEVAAAEPLASHHLEHVQTRIGTVIDVRQRTPQRVAHRRADLDRMRQVEVLRLAQAAPDTLEVEIRCSHGTYVKEWVSGDDGRSEPSLADLLGVACRCAVLDVLEILTDSQAPASSERTAPHTAAGEP
ncbi:MAG: hypothetical protein KDC87_03760 [Planctomycetes bacterium]|nr:hypothetical protein [Planctomycetota bacterium]MCB9869935.1 hypothetical protein [Planctomycetota bacterium]